MRALPLFLLLLSAFLLSAAERHVLYLPGESNAATAKRAFRKLALPPDIRFHLIPDASDRKRLQTEIARADLIVANGLIAEFREALLAHARLGKTKIYLLGTRLNC